MNDNFTLPDMPEFLRREVLTKEDLETLTKEERGELSRYFTAKMQDPTINGALGGEEREKFYQKILPVLPKEMKKYIWENEHETIKAAYYDFLSTHGRTPGVTYLSQQTCYSSSTVERHLREFNDSKEFAQSDALHQLAKTDIMAVIIKQARAGDMKAAKLYFQAMGDIQTTRPAPVYNNNYIQINNSILSQSVLSQLPPEALRQLEIVIRQYVPLQDLPQAIEIQAPKQQDNEA